jgi:hypothetical protein
LAAGALGVLAVISACGSPGTSTAARADAGTGTAKHSAQSDTVSDQGLSGLGATMAAWNAHHGSSAAYSNVTPQGGRVVEYTVSTGTISLTTAIKRAKQELPSDTREIWAAARGNCYQVELTSHTLSGVLSDPAIGDYGGGILAIINTLLPDGSAVYHPTAAVNQSMLAPGTYASPDDAPDC